MWIVLYLGFVKVGGFLKNVDNCRLLEKEHVG